MSENKTLPKGLSYYEYEGVLIINCDDELWERAYNSNGYFRGFRKKLEEKKE